jgi:hypothetical protein
MSDDPQGDSIHVLGKWHGLLAEAEDRSLANRLLQAGLADILRELKKNGWI